MDKNSAAILPLLRLKTRLLINTVFNWKSAGKLIAGILAMAFTAYVMSDAASDLIASFQVIPFGQYLLEWVLAIICIYLFILVFTGDLLTGHSLNAGQMSSDFNFLISLPIPPLSLIIIKLFERLITDYIGLLILLTGIFALTFHQGFSLSGLFAGLGIYLQISLLIGLGINLLIIAMRRFLRPASINNFFSMLGYLSAFLTLFPYLLLSNFPMQSFNWLVQYSNSFNSNLFKCLKPFKWLSASLLKQGKNQEFIYWSIAWLCLMLVGCFLFYIMIRFNWLTCSHSAAKRKSSGGKRVFHGFFRKEMLLLKSDFNLLINAILMPITIIILEIYFLKTVISFNASNQTLNVIYAAVIYFCMFGPINSIGAEGRSIAIIECLPVSPSGFIYKKFFFWSIIAGLIFIPATVLTFDYLGFITSIIWKAAASIFLFTIVCVWISINISAIFPRYESKILQQKSTMGGKFVALALMMFASPIQPGEWLSLLNLIILAIALLLIWQIARISLKTRLDPEVSCLTPSYFYPYILLALVFTGTDTAMRQLFQAVIPGQDTGLSSWLVACFIFFPILIIFSGQNFKLLRNNKKPSSSSSVPFAASFFISTLLSGISAFFLYRLIMAKQSYFLQLSSDIKSLFYSQVPYSVLPSASEVDSSSFFQCFSELLTDNYLFGLALLLIPIAAALFETVYRGFLITSIEAKSFKHKLLLVALSVSATALTAPAGLEFVFAAVGLVAFMIYYKSRHLTEVYLFSTVSALSIFLTLLFM
ncbi:MAG: hypothetical protein ACQETH_14640 [Candidatus Rifleibacteriota bacterium]